MTALRRGIVFLIALTAVACGVAPPPAPARADGRPVAVRAAPVPLKLDEPDAKQVGRLIWRGGVSLAGSSASGFGGWSDLHVAPDGRTLRAISDVCDWLTATIERDAAGNPTGLSDARMGRLRGLDGAPIADKDDGDAEALTALPDGGWLVAFERRHRLWRYPPGAEAEGGGLAGKPAAVSGPADLSRQPANGGIEAMTVLKDGSLLLLSEVHSDRPGTTLGWIGKPADAGWTWQSFHYTPEPDFNPTALAQLPDGSLAVLERAFSVAQGVRCRVVRLDAAKIVPDATVRGEELARLATPYAVDNLEGLAISRGARGETLLWLLSDDNFSPIQRTLLLLFELAP